MQPLTTLAALIRARSGLVVGADKEYLLETRLAPLLRREGLASLAELVCRLDSTDCETLKQDVTEAMATHETLFFRDAKAFAHLHDVGLPALLKQRAPGARLRIWSAAASTGQEAYSLAIICAELGLSDRTAEITGTDFARQPLERARDGRYTQYEVQRGLPVMRLLRHFTADAAGPAQTWRVNAGLRAMCRFRQWNLLDDPAPLGQFDVVFCRNVLFYFDRSVRMQVLARIRERLAPDGLLYLGATESASGIDDTLLRDGACYVGAKTSAKLGPEPGDGSITPSRPAPPRATALRPGHA